MRTKVVLQIITFLLVSFIIAGCSHQNKNMESDAVPEVTDRMFGIAGYTPVNFPNSSSEEISQFFRDIESFSQIHGVHTDWRDTRIIKLTTENIDLPIVLVLGFQNPEEWENSVDQFIKKTDEILASNPEIRFLGIGNEVNDLKRKNPTKFPKFITAYNSITSELRLKHPDIKFFTTIQYETMFGKALLRGEKNLQPDVEILKDFESNSDLIVFTSYPFFQYKTPVEIPLDYYAQIKNYTNLPIAFSEIGWISQSIFTGKQQSLNASGYEGSEEEQVHFLNTFNTLTLEVDMIFANWIFLNDSVDWKDVNSTNVLFDSIGMRMHNGQEKQMFSAWRDLIKK